MKKHSYSSAPRSLWPRMAALGLSLAALALSPLRADIYQFGILAGSGANLDHTDGTGTNARFYNPTSVAIDSSGTLYVADGGDHTVRKITAGGVVSVLAGSSGQAGSADGSGSGARFQYPYAVAVDASGNVYVTDIGDHTVRKITAGGSVSTLAGTVGVPGSVDGAGTTAQFNLPQGIAVDSTGNVFVADTNNSTIRKIATNGSVSTFAGAAGQTGTADNVGGSARFSYPFGLATDTVGNVYVADFGNSSIRKITTGGNVTTLAGSSGQTGSADGTGLGARFDHPSAVSVDGAGNVYVIDTSNQTVRRITTGGTVTTLAGSPGLGGKVDGVGATARFFYAGGIAANSAGTTIYVADTGNHTIRAVSAAGSVSTYAGSSGLTGIADGAGSAALFAYPNGLAVDSAGTVYVADHNNNTIRRVTAGGAVTTLAGGASLPAGSADGVGIASRFSGPTGIAVDGTGNVYVADTDNNTIRKITAAGVVSTFAGAAGQTGSNDGAGAGARFNKPQGLTVDSAGNLYVADTNNSVIRKITPAGLVSTLAGAAGQTGTLDGAGGAARFNGPYAVAVDGSGNVFVSDFFNNTIRQVTSTGNVSTIAGLAGVAGAADGFGGFARFNQAYAIAVDGSGNILVADTYNRVIRKITNGTVTTLGGSLSRFYYPQGLAVDTSGNLYVADGDNQTITKGTFFVSPPNGTPVNGQNVAVGQSTTFTLSSTPANVNIQWQVSTNNGATWTSLSNDATYGGVTTSTLSVSNVTAAFNGRQYRAQFSNVAGTGASAPATLTVTGAPPVTGTARLSNLSVRTQVGTGANAVFVGLAVGGSGTKQMIVRGIGPGLTQFGVTGALATPQLSLFNGASVLLTSNTGWSTAPNASLMPNAFAAVGAFALTPGTADCAILQPLANGTYSAQIVGLNNSTGIGLAEFYDADSGTPATRLTNASARAPVGTGSGVLTAGFAILGTGSENVLIRGIGPSLTQFGVAGALAAPRITVFNSAGTVIASNAGWDGSATLSSTFTNVGAFALTPGSGDCALILSLQAGTYTVQLSGANNTTGTGLIEVYEVP